MKSVIAEISTCLEYGTNKSNLYGYEQEKLVNCFDGAEIETEHYFFY